MRQGEEDGSGEAVREGAKGAASIEEVTALPDRLASTVSRWMAAAMRARWHQLLKESCVSAANSRDSVRRL